MKTVHFFIFSALITAEFIHPDQFDNMNNSRIKEYHQNRIKQISSRQAVARQDLACIQRAETPDQLLSCILCKDQWVGGFTSDIELMATLKEKRSEFKDLKNKLTNGSLSSLEIGETKAKITNEFSKKQFQNTKEYFEKYHENLVKYYDILLDDGNHIGQHERTKILEYLKGHYGVQDEKKLEELIKTKKLQPNPTDHGITSLVHVLHWGEK